MAAPDLDITSEKKPPHSTNVFWTFHYDIPGTPTQ